MFFYLSKILLFLIQPIIWVFIVLVWALCTKDLIRRKKLLWASVIMLYFFSNSFIADEFMRMWEVHYEKTDYAPEQESNFDYAVVLGGTVWYNEKLEKPQFLRSADRIFQTLWLLQQKKVKKIIISGGSGSIEHPEQKEGIILKKWLMQIGIPDSSIIVESESKNTHENAEFTKPILEKLDYRNKKVLLVTSSFHMRRALACFKKAGVDNLIPYLTDPYSGPRKFGWDHCFIPSSEAMTQYNLLIHEIVGFITYKIAGYC